MNNASDSIATINQMVIFVGGPNDGRAARIAFTDFYIGMLVTVGEIKYTVRSGPIAETVAKTKRAMEHGIIVLEVAQ